MIGIDQLGIMFTGATAIFLSQDKRASWRRWSSVLGLIGQPFWFYAAWSAEHVSFD